MYQITKNSKILALCDEPRYVKIKESTKAYIQCKKEDAIGVAIGGIVYPISEVNVNKIDGSEVLFATKEQLDSLNLNVTNIEDVLCDLDSANQ